MQTAGVVVHMHAAYINDSDVFDRHWLIDIINEIETDVCACMHMHGSLTYITEGNKAVAR